ncbi:MAG TPA: helix-turn-helix transcriptional regulator [Bryobacteraceae bacterium]|nr:helix-turn-helix transcriptional regulator [Bryobacteraceae bacterium]
MDVSLLIRQRLKDLNLDQKDLAGAAEVTESYISQLLARKKAPPSSGRTAIYEKIGEFLKLPSGELSRLADLQRREQLRKKVAALPRPLFKEARTLILRKCASGRREEAERIFEKDAFGELERLVTQKLLEVAQGVARNMSDREDWLHSMARASGRSDDQARVALSEFLDLGVFDAAVENWIPYLDSLIDSWDIDLGNFSISIAPGRHRSSGGKKRFEFVEVDEYVIEPGLDQFLKDPLLSGDATREEIEFLKRLRFRRRRPSAIYYYRELQNLRDPLHFSPESAALLSNETGAGRIP